VGTNGRPSVSKRQKEQTRLERQREKAAKRQQRKIEKQNRGPGDTASESDTGSEALSESSPSLPAT
jgi:hypothetical protein